MDTVEFVQQLMLAVFTACLTALLTILINKSQKIREAETKILTASSVEINAYGISIPATDKEKIEAFDVLKFELRPKLQELGEQHIDKTRNTRYILFIVLFFSITSISTLIFVIFNIIPYETAKTIKNISNIALTILMLIAVVNFSKANQIWKKIIETDLEYKKIIKLFQKNHK